MDEPLRPGDDGQKPVPDARHRRSRIVDMTRLAQLIDERGIPAHWYGGGGVYVLRIGERRPDPDGDYLTELSAGPAYWDNDIRRYLSGRLDFCVGPDSGAGAVDDLAEFWYPPADTTEDAIAAHIVAILAEVRAAESLPVQANGSGPTLGSGADATYESGDGQDG